MNAAMSADESSEQGAADLEWRFAMWWILLVVLVVAIMAVFSRLSGDEAPALRDGPTDAIVAGDYAPWRVGDTHVHLVGDSGVLFNNRCRPNQALELEGVMSSLDQCAARLVQSTNEIAAHNGVDWAILTEHGPWLGSPQLVQCSESIGASLATVLVGGLSKTGGCVRHASTFYSYSASVDAWGAIRDQLPPADSSGPHLMLGQEIGTAAGISVLCARAESPLRAPIAARRGPGHVGVFTLGDTQLPLQNTVFDCREQDYLQDLQDEGLFGAINHPDNGDQGSDWHCWADVDVHPSGEPCERGLESFAGGVLPIRATGPVPSAAAVAAVAIVSDTKAPRDSTIANVVSQLRQGRVVGFVGGSDSHAITRKRNFEQSLANDGKIGLAARTYAFAPSQPDESFGVDPLRHPVRFALASQATTASLGPLLSVQVEGVRAGGSVGLLAGNSVRMLVDWPPEPQTWPHIQVGSGGYEITNGELVPRSNERSHRPEAIEISVIAVDPTCAPECAAIPQPRRIAVPAVGSDLAAPGVVADDTDLDNGTVVLDLALPASPTQRWAIVVRGDYGADLVLGDDRTYPVQAWSSPIWVDGTPLAAEIATDDSEWDRSGATVSQPSTFSFPEQSFMPTAVRVVDQFGKPVPNATIRLYRRDGDQLVPLPSRSRALAPPDRYQPALTNLLGDYRFSASPGPYVAVATAPLCRPGTPPPVTSLVAGSIAAEPIRLQCPDETALAVSYRPINNGFNPPDVEVGVVCQAGDEQSGEQIVVEPQLVPANETTELVRVPLGWLCTATEYPRAGIGAGQRLLTDEVRTERVTARGVEFVSFTTAEPQPASFAIDALPYDPSDAGEPVELSLWCPGYDGARQVEMSLGERRIVGGVTDGDTCEIAYLGDRFVFPPAELHQVDVLGQVIEPGVVAGVGHDHEHDAVFSLVELHFGRDNITADDRPVDEVLPLVIAAPDPTPVKKPVAKEPVVQEPVVTPPKVEASVEAQPEQDARVCDPGFERVGERCAREVPALRTVTRTPVACQAGWELVADETSCRRTVEVRVPVTTTSSCPDGVVSNNDGETCTRWIREADPIPGEPQCPAGTLALGSGAGLTCEVVTGNPDVVCEGGFVDTSCPGSLVCPAGWVVVATGPGSPRCSSVTPVFADPIPGADSCPAGSQVDGDTCRLDEIIFEPVPPIVEQSCPAELVLVGAECVGSRIEQQPPTGGVERVVLSCPAGTSDEGTSGVQRCIEYRDLGG